MTKRHSKLQHVCNCIARGQSRVVEVLVRCSDDTTLSVVFSLYITVEIKMEFKTTWTIVLGQQTLTNWILMVIK